MAGKSFFKFALAFSAIITLSIMSLVVSGYLNDRSDSMKATVVENN